MTRRKIHQYIAPVAALIFGAGPGLAATPAAPTVDGLAEAVTAAWRGDAAGGDEVGGMLFEIAAAGEARGAPASEAPSPPAAVTFRDTIFPFGDTDNFRVRLPGGGGRVFTFRLANFTAGFDPAFRIRAGGRSFFVNARGPNGDESFRLRVTGTLTATVTVGAAGGRTVGAYQLRVTP